MKEQFAVFLRRLRNTIQNIVLSIVRRFAALQRRYQLLGACLILFAVIGVYGGLSMVQHRHSYVLSAGQQKLLVKTPVDVAKINESEQTVEFNKADEEQGSKQSVTVAASGNGTGSVPYKATLAKTGHRQLEFSNSSGDLSFSLEPQFAQSNGQRQGGRVVYPGPGASKQVYSYMRNGVQEDILLDRAPGDTASYTWKINHSSSLEPRLLPNGSVGMYSANPALYGNLQVSDAKTQSLVDKARQGDKSSLAFVLPKPFIKSLDGKARYENVKYILKGDLLTIAASELRQQSYPLTIDPSVVVTTTNDFQQGYDDGMIDYTTAGQITRSNLSAGSVGPATQQTSAFTTARNSSASVAYNGYLYIAGGVSGGTNLNDIQYCPLNTNGIVGACTQQANAFVGVRNSLTAVAYNGYLYIVGGYFNATSQNDIQHCPINADGSVGACVQQTNAFTGARGAHASAVYNGFIYITGGIVANVDQNDIQHCPINADGSVGACVQQTNAFTGARDRHASVAYNGYLYIVGGEDSTATPLSDIQYCPINTNGSVGACTQQTNAITGARSSLTSVVYSGNLYIIGGKDVSGIALKDIQYCPVNANGSVGSCTQQSNAFTPGRSGHASIVSNGYVYLIGGYGAGANQNDIQYFQVSTAASNALGAVANFGATTSMPTVRFDHASVAYNGYLYILGGTDSGGSKSDVQYAPINANGTIGTWTATTSFSTARAGLSSVAYNGYLYVMGGLKDSLSTACNGTTSQYCSDVQYAPINANGTIGTWTATTSFSTARNYHTSAVYNGYLYIMGGQHATNDTACNSTASTYCSDVQYAPINANGTIGTWTATTSFTAARRNTTAVAYNGYLYVMGGLQSVANTACNSTSSTYCSDVQYAPINANGTIGTWTATTSFSFARFGHTSVVYDGYLYIMGGQHTTNDTACNSTASTSCSDVQYAPINANGTIGTWTATTSFSTARYSHAAAVYNGYLYIDGGVHSGTNTTCNSTASTYCSDVQAAALFSPAQRATYERVIDMGSVVNSIDSVSFSGAAKCGAELWYQSAGSNGVMGGIAKLPFVLPGTTYTLGTTNQRYLWLKMVFQDSTCGTNSYATDITVNYTAGSGPAAPTLSTPSSGATGVSTTPTFQLRSTDPDSDDLRYKIDVCSTSNCSSVVRTIDQTAAQTGWSGQDASAGTAYTGSSVLASSTMAAHTYQAPALTGGAQYWWRAYAIDPAGSNTFSNSSGIQSFTTVGTNVAPNAPTLISPSSAATGILPQPQFQVSATDTNNDYLQYKIQICGNSTCSSVLRTIDQTASQTGWTAQNAASSTAYTSGSTAIHSYQAPGLTPGTQCWWRAYAIDPAGSNTFSSASSIQSFTAGSSSTQIRGGTTIRGGTQFYN